MSSPSLRNDCIGSVGIVPDVSDSFVSTHKSSIFPLGLFGVPLPDRGGSSWKLIISSSRVAASEADGLFEGLKFKHEAANSTKAVI